MPFYANNRFNRGEIDPSLHDRQDLDFYPGACRRMENWFPAVTGGVFRRPGFYELLKTETDGWKSVAKKVFRFQDEDFLLILLGKDTVTVNVELYRFVDGGLESLHSATITADDPLDVRSHVSMVAFGPAVFVTSRMFPVQRVFVSYDDVEEKWDGDMQQVVWFRELVGTVSVDSGDSTWTGEDTLFQEQLSVGDIFLFKGAVFEVAAIESNTSMTSTANHDGLTLSGERIQAVESNPFGDGEYPALCTFFQSRLVLFSTNSKPVHMWASKIQDPFTIIPGSVYDDAPIEYELLVENVDAFNWVHTLDRIYLGGSQGEYSVGSADVALTPTSVGFSRISSLGGSPVAPTSVESSILFVSFTGQQVFSVQFDFQRQGFVSRNISQMAPHLFRSDIVSMSYRPPVESDFSPRLFTVLSSGEVRVCSIIETEEVLAWHRMTPPDGFVFNSVEATSGGAFFSMLTESGQLVIAGLQFPTEEQYYSMDFLLHKTVTVGNKIENMPSYLEGLVVTVVDPERGWVGDYKVEEGSIQLPDLEHSETVVVGLLFKSTLELLPSAFQSGQGVSLSRKRRLVRAIVSVDETQSLFVGGTPLLPGVPTPKPIFRSGAYEVRFLGWLRQDYLKLETSSPYPALISSVVREVNL